VWAQLQGSLIRQLDDAVMPAHVAREVSWWSSVADHAATGYVACVGDRGLMRRALRLWQAANREREALEGEWSL
jgi:hypothetical protein